MLAPRRRITFTSRTTGKVIEYDYVCDIEINRSIESLTDTATITIPRKLVYENGDPLSPQNQGELKDYVRLVTFNELKNINYVTDVHALFKRGDRVTIELCYEYDNKAKLKTRFDGYITKITSTLPITITCEDSMWLLKQSNVVFPDPKKYVANATQKNTLKQLLDGILSNVKQTIFYKTVDDNYDVGDQHHSNISVAQVLQILKDTHGLYSYFKDDGSLYVGFSNDLISNNLQEFAMEEVVISDDNLEWQNSDDIAIKVKGISTDSKNKTITYEARFVNGKIYSRIVNKGDEDDGFEGDTVTKYTQNQSEEGLKKMVGNLLPTYTYTGFRGYIKTLGEPVVNHGDICYLTSKKLPERNGYYLIKAVKITDGKDGYFQTITLGIKLYKK